MYKFGPPKVVKLTCVEEMDHGLELDFESHSFCEAISPITYDKMNKPKKCVDT